MTNIFATIKDWLIVSVLVIVEGLWGIILYTNTVACMVIVGTIVCMVITLPEREGLNLYVREL